MFRFSSPKKIKNTRDQWMCLASLLEEKIDRSIISRNAIWWFTWILPDPKTDPQDSDDVSFGISEAMILIDITYPTCHLRALVWKTNTKISLRWIHVLCCFPKAPWTWLMVPARSLLTIIPTFWRVRCSFMFLHYACNFQKWWYQRLCVSKHMARLSMEWSEPMHR